MGTLVKVFPETEGYLGPEALEQEEWARAPGHGKRDRRNRQYRIRELDDGMEDTEVSNYMQKLDSNDNRRTAAPAGPRPSKFQRGKGAAHKPGTNPEDDVDDDEDDALEDEEHDMGAGGDAPGRKRGGRLPLAVGRRVRVKKSVDVPAYGWGKVRKTSIGVLVEFDEDRDVVVDFPEQDAWVGRRKELECLPEYDQETVNSQDAYAYQARGGGSGIDVTDINIEFLWGGGRVQGDAGSAAVENRGADEVEGGEGKGVRWQKDVAEQVADLDIEGEEFVVARGGRGGRGNTSFATKQHRAPKRATSGAAGQRLRIELELKTVADVGLVGYPNAGKSSLLCLLSKVCVCVRARALPPLYCRPALRPSMGVVLGPLGSRGLVLGPRSCVLPSWSSTQVGCAGGAEVGAGVSCVCVGGCVGSEEVYWLVMW